MGYTLPERTATIEFDELPGFEVVVRVWPVEMTTFFEVQRLAEQYQESSKVDELRAMIEGLASHVGPHLVSWTLDAPPTEDNLRRQPWELIVGIATAWHGAVAGVPAPLPRLSGSGGPSAGHLASTSRSNSKPRSSAKRS